MSENQIAAAAATSGMGGSGGDPHKAELALSRIADSRANAVDSPALMIGFLIWIAVTIAAGMWLRARLAPRPWEIGTTCAVLLVAALILPWLTRRRGKREPKWVEAARIHERTFPGRIPPETVAAVGRIIDTMPRKSWASAHLYVSRCTDGESPHQGTCYAGGTFSINGRLLVLLGEHLATGPTYRASAVLGHEARHVYGWRLRLSTICGTAIAAGFAVIAWALPWPWMASAIPGIYAFNVLSGWAIEMSCDLGSAETHGPDAMLATLDYLARVLADARAARTRWSRYAHSVLKWATGPSHPPFPLRKAAIHARWPQAQSPDRFHANRQR
jgi:Zn-dependent protease with chaperone function